MSKYVFLAIGRHLKRTASGEFETAALPADEIRASIGMSEATVARSLKAITTGQPDSELEPLRSGQRGTVNRYRLRRELKLPLLEEPFDRRLAVVPTWVRQQLSNAAGLLPANHIGPRKVRRQTG